MPRKRIKKYPKTTGIQVTASCGHEFTHRFNLPFMMVGAVRTAELDAELEKEKTFQEGVNSKNICPNCYAEEDVKKQRTETENLLRPYNLEIFPPLNGSVRMRSYAENIRMQWWQERVNFIEGLTFKTVFNANMGLKLAAKALAEAYPRQLQENQTEDLENLIEEIQVSSFLYARLKETDNTKAWALASWLLVRQMTAGSYGLYEKTEAIDWIKMHKTTYRLIKDTRASIPEHGIIFTAALVASMGDWEDRFQAESVFKNLLGETFDDTLQVIQQRKGNPITDVLDEAAVYNTLAGRPQESKYIF